jgi:hypothetical protein
VPEILSRCGSFAPLKDGATVVQTAGLVGAVALGQEGASDPRVINYIEMMVDGRPISAHVVDAGDARVEVDRGDSAILKVKENIDLPALNVGLNYPFEFADPIFQSGQRLLKGHRRIDRVRGPADS